MAVPRHLPRIHTLFNGFNDLIGYALVNIQPLLERQCFTCLLLFSKLHLLFSPLPLVEFGVVFVLKTTPEAIAGEIGEARATVGETEGDHPPWSGTRKGGA